MTPVTSHEITRRTVLKAGAWAAPAVAVAVAVPAAAASTAPNPCVFSTVLTATPATQNPTTLQATNSRGELYTVVITSTVSGDTVVGQNVGGEYREYNTARDGSGIAGEYQPDGSLDYVFGGFGPTGAIVLNQRTATVDGDPSTPKPGATDAQTLTFTFFDPHGTVITTVRDVQIDIFDISSVNQRFWRTNYWDAVGFSVPPTSVSTSGPYPTGSGAGTTADPYRRTDGHSPTTSAGQIEDTFSFDTFGSGSTLTYTQHDQRQGWHFMSISRLQFTLDECS